MSSSKPHQLKINPKLLLFFYGSIPVAIILVLLDIFLLHSSLKKVLSADPNNYALFTLLFTLPHILSSFFGFLEKEYIAAYKPKLLKGLRYSFLTAILLPIISLKLAFFVFAIYTMYHVFRQQSGIARSLMRGGNKYHAYWEWLGIILSLGIYLSIYTTYSPSKLLIYLWFAVSAIYTIFGYKASHASHTTIGTHYFWMSHLVPFISAIFLLIGYPIFSIAVPRIIHDLTGYTFYITHDYNRFAQTHGNYLYRTFRPLKLPVALVNPIVSIGIAALFQLHIFAGVYVLLTVLFLFHYYTESFIWKKESIHRQYIGYTA